MSKVRVCDICHKQVNLCKFEDFYRFKRLRGIGELYHTTKIEMCNECFNDFIEFIMEKKIKKG